jgi:hypothetical protein
MNDSTEDASIPANVSLNTRAAVAAGLAKLVDEVNRYAAPIREATAAIDNVARQV